MSSLVGKKIVWSYINCLKGSGVGTIVDLLPRGQEVSPENVKKYYGEFRETYQLTHKVDRVVCLKDGLKNEYIIIPFDARTRKFLARNMKVNFIHEDKVKSFSEVMTEELKDLKVRKVIGCPQNGYIITFHNCTQMKIGIKDGELCVIIT